MLLNYLQKLVSRAKFTKFVVVHTEMRTDGTFSSSIWFSPSECIVHVGIAKDIEWQSLVCMCICYTIYTMHCTLI